MSRPHPGHLSDEEEDVGEGILDEFRTLITQHTSTITRKKSAVGPGSAKVLESCLYDLDRQKDVMIETLGVLEQSNADRLTQLGADLVRANRNVEMLEQRATDSQSRAESYQHDVHALVHILSLAFHSGQWKFASADFQTVSGDMLPPTGSSSKEGMRVSLLEKQLADRGRKIQALQQELVSGSASQRLLKEQITSRDNEIADLRQSIATNQQQLASALQGLDRYEEEAGQRHTSLVSEVEQRDSILTSLQKENTRLQKQHETSVQSSLDASNELGKLRTEIDGLTSNLKAEQRRSSDLSSKLQTSELDASDLRDKLEKQEAQVNGLMGRLNSQISELQSNVSVLEEKYKRACTETRECQSELQGCQEAQANSKADAAMYHDQLLDSRAKLEQWEASVQLMRNEHCDEITDRDQVISQLRQQVAGATAQTSKQVSKTASGASALHSRIAELEAEKKSLDKQVHKGEDEVAVISVKVETLEEENKLCHQQISSLDGQNTSLLSKLEKVQAGLQEKGKEVAYLTECQQDLQQTVQELQEGQVLLDEAEYEKVELEGEVDKLQRQLAVARTELAEKTKSVEDQHAQLMELEATCVRHTDMLKGRDEEIERLRTDDFQAGVCNDSSDEPSDLSLQFLEAKEELSTLSCSLEQAQSDLDKWKETSKANESSMNRFKAECDRVRKLLVLKTEELQSAKDHATEADRDQMKMLQEVQSERDRSTQLQIEVNLLRHNRSQVEESLTRELESLRSHSSYIATADQLASELQESKQELTQLKRSLAASEDETDKLMGKLRAEQDQNSKLHAKCLAADVTARKAAAAAETSKLEAEDAGESELHSLKQSNDMLTVELNQRQNVIEGLRKEVDEHKLQQRQINHELKLKRLRLQQVDQDVDAQRIQNTVLKEKVMAHERQQSMLEVALERSQEEREKLSKKITDLADAARHTKLDTAVLSKTNSLEGQVATLTSQLNSSQASFLRLQRMYDDTLSELSSSKNRHQAESNALEEELSHLRSEQDVVTGTHQQLVSQLQTTVVTLGNQLDKVTLQRDDDDIDGAEDDEDERRHASHNHSSMSTSASFLHNVSVARLEGKCRDLEGQLSASKTLHGNVLQCERQRYDEQQGRFQRECDLLRKQLAATEAQLRSCHADNMKKDHEISSILEKAEDSRQENLRKVTGIHARLEALNARQKPTDSGHG